MAGYRLLPQWTLSTGHSSLPLTPSSAHLCLHGNTTVFVPRHPLVRASFHHLPFSRWWDRGTAMRPCSPLPHQASLTGYVLPGRASGLAPGRGAPVTLFLSRSYGLSLPSPVHGEEGQGPCPPHVPCLCMAQWLPSGLLPPSSRKGFMPLPLEEQGSVGCTYRLSLCPSTVCHLVAPWHFRGGLWGTHKWVSCS